MKAQQFVRIATYVAMGVVIASCGGGEGGGALQPVETVSAAGTGSLNLRWLEPRFNEDGSCTNLRGYQVNLGLSPRNYIDYRPVLLTELDCQPNGTQTSCGPVRICHYQLRGLESASWYITVQAHNTHGNTSRHSNEIIRTVY